MADGATEHLIADVLDVWVPCRRFSIKAHVTQDRQLPVVDEFLLRLLRIGEQISVGRLKRFFGFSEAELQAVLLDLTSAGFVSVLGEDVTLTPAGRDLFKATASDGAPRLTQIEAREESVWFDLVSRNMMRGTRFQPAPNLITLREDPSARQLPEAFARQAFELNFRDFARRVLRHPEADKLAIYAVTDVLPLGFGYQPLATDVQFNLRDKVEFTLSFDAFKDEPMRFAGLSRAVADEWDGLQHPETSSTGADEYERLTGDERIRHLRAATTGAEWLPYLQAGSRAGQRPHFGPPYLIANSAAFCRAVSDELKKRRGEAPSAELYWFRPGGSAWGRTLRVSQCIGEVREVLRAAGATSVETTMIVPRGVPQGMRKVFKRLFDRGVLAPSGQLPADLEVLLVPSTAAFVTIHMPLGKASLAIGTVVTDPDRLRRIQRRVMRERENSEALWQVSASPRIMQ